MGGSGDDQAFAIEVGPDGSIYVAGWTESPDFPAAGAKGPPGERRDAFLTRFDNLLTTSLVQNFFGSNGNDQAFEVTVDRDGNAYITGFTDNRGFPQTDGSRWAGGRDAFTAAVSPDGELLHSGTLGGLGDDTGTGIDFFPEDDFVVVVTGGTTGTLNFPLTQDAFQTQRAGPTDGWVDALRLDTTAGVPFTVDNRSTSLLGGNGTDFVDSLSFSKFSINVGFRFDEDDVFAAMTTDSDNMAEFGVPNPTRAGGTDGHVTVLRLDPSFAPAWPPAEDSVAFATYLPGGPDDESEVFFETFKGSVGGPSSKDKVYFFYNAGSNVPTFAGAAVENYPGGPQSLVMSELVFDEQTGTAEFRSTYAGGPNFDQAARMAVDPNGAPAGVGLTFSQIPTTPDAVFPNLNGVFGGYFMLFSGDLTQIDYATYLWGNRNSNVTDVAFDPLGQIHATGINGPGAFTTPGSFQPDFGGDPFDATVGVITRPFVFNNTPVNAAGFQPGASPQQISAVGGANIGPEPPALLVFDEDRNLLTEIGETRVLVDGDATPITFASQFQDNFVFRFSVGFRFLQEKGEDPPVASVQVEFEGDLSNVVEVPVLEANPGLFAFDGSGQGQGAILNPDFSINSVDNPAPSDSFIVLFGTGGGITDPICPDASLGPSEEPLPRLQLPQRVLVDGVEAQVPYAGSAPGLVCGVNQWNVVPTNNPSGPAVPIQACSGDICSNIVTAAFSDTSGTAGEVVISQVYGGGGNQGATLTNDFVELFNRGSTPVELTDWTVQYAPAMDGEWNATPLGGVVLPGQYYLVQEGMGQTGGTVPLPTPDAIGGIGLSAQSGKVALVSSSDLLVGPTPSDPAIVDFVGYGDTDFAEGSAAGVLSNQTAALRRGGGCIDTDDNGSDFDVGAPAPRNRASGFGVCN